MITLKTLPQATAQEVFDQIATHLLKQNQRAFKPGDGSCMYCTPSGLKCAAGCLISDDEYTSEFEGNNWVDLAAKDQRLVPDNHLDLIFALQRIHDNYDPSVWHEKLAQLAYWHELTMPKI